MTTIEERLDQYIDALNEGRPTNGSGDDAELEDLFSTVRQLHTLRGPDWPDADFPETLAAGLANELTPHQNGHHAADIAPSVSNPWTRRPEVPTEEPEPASPTRLRQIAQFGGAIAALSIFALVLVVVFRDAGGGGFLTGAAPDQPVMAQIAFTAYEESPDPNAEPRPGIYLVNADGTGLVELAEGVLPSWSPDGSRIAYTTFGNTTGALHVMNADGSNQQRLTDSNVDEITPAWSPDGEHIAFLRASANEDSDDYSIWMVNADGSGEQMLVEESTGIFFPIAWSPDGSQIAFNRQVGDAHRIDIVTVATGETRTLVESVPGMSVSLTWSTDGNTIALMAETEDNPGWTRIHLLDVQTGELSLIAATPGAQVAPAWSPDGRWLAFAGQFDEMDAIYGVPTENINAGPILLHAEQDASISGLSWSPDSQEIAFIRDTQTEVNSTDTETTFEIAFQVAVIDLEGSDLKILTDDIPLAALSPPAWRPTTSSPPVEVTPTISQPVQTVVPVEPTVPQEPTVNPTPTSAVPASTIVPIEPTITTEVSADQAIEIAREAAPGEPHPFSSYSVDRAELTEWIIGVHPDAEYHLVWRVEIAGAPAAIYVDATIGEVVTPDDYRSEDMSISSDDAIAIARQFLNDQTSDLEVQRYTGQRYEIVQSSTVYYEVTRSIEGAEVLDHVNVDGESGMVLEVAINSHTSLHTSRDPITEEEAQRIATSFARTWVVDFDDMVLQDENTDHTGPGEQNRDRLYSVRWVLQDPDSGAVLPTWASMRINLETGLIYQFNQHSVTFDDPSYPPIDPATAQEIALEHSRKDTMTSADVHVSNVDLIELIETTPRDEEVRPAWLVELRGAPKDILVDVMTGEVIELASSNTNQP